jgi:simple sugar transport system permease protein
MTVVPLTFPTEKKQVATGIGALVGAVAIVLGLVAALLLAVGVDPLMAAQAMWTGSFGSTRSLGETLIRTTPLLLIALTLIPSLRAGLYNIGAPGQMAFGALASTVIALQGAGLPSYVLIPACAIGGCLAGAAAGFVPGVLKARWNANEIITTLAVNFIAVAILGYLLNGVMQSDFANLPQSATLPANSSLPTLIPGTRTHFGLLLALLAVPLLWAVDRSRLGYRLRIFGANPSLAKQTKVRPGRYTVGLMTLGGAGAGLAGWMQVTALDNRLYVGVADPVGYAGLFVALLGALHPLGTVIAAFALGALLHGGDSLQVGAGVTPEIVQVLLGLILLAYAVRATKSAATTNQSKQTKQRGGPAWIFWKRS